MLPIQQNRDAVTACIKCSREKQQHDFYEKEKNENGLVLRRDHVCKDCRKTERLERYRLRSVTTPQASRATNQSKKSPKSRPERIIEPRIHETSRLANERDFSGLEQICGKELQLAERHDAVQRLNEFVSLLRTEYGRMVGSHVYIRKN